MGQMQRRKRIIRELHRQPGRPMPSWHQVAHVLDGPFAELTTGFAGVVSYLRKRKALFPRSSAPSSAKVVALTEPLPTSIVDVSKLFDEIERAADGRVSINPPR